MDAERLSLRALVAHVSNSIDAVEPITYSELANRIGRINKHGFGHGHGMGSVLGRMGHLLQGIKDEWLDKVPYIQSLVVDKTGPLKGLPAEGIKEFWSDYPSLTKKEKHNRAQAEYLKIRDFGSRWNRVLEALGIEPIQQSIDINRGNEAISSHFGRGGESINHIQLKNYIADNPELVGATRDYSSHTEYALPSLDTLDVLFKSDSEWVAVEVKSSVSDNLLSDYERGVYQCVKYRSLLEAMQKDKEYEVPPIKVILVLESGLPQKYQILASQLEVEFIDNIKLIR